MKSVFAMIVPGLLLTVFCPHPGRCDMFSAHPAVSQQELSCTRGGFSVGNGLEIAIGIERAVYVNGVLQTLNTLSFSHQAKGSGATDAALAEAGGTVKLIQVGSGNSFQPLKINGDLLPLGLTVIQNSLDKVVIKNATVVNATVTNAGLARSVGMTTLIQGQLLHALH